MNGFKVFPGLVAAIQAKDLANGTEWQAFEQRLDNGLGYFYGFDQGCLGTRALRPRAKVFHGRSSTTARFPLGSRPITGLTPLGCSIPRSRSAHASATGSRLSRQHLAHRFPIIGSMPLWASGRWWHIVSAAIWSLEQAANGLLGISAGGSRSTLQRTEPRAGVYSGAGFGFNSQDNPQPWYVQFG
jgi:hypothetical protein